MGNTMGGVCSNGIVKDDFVSEKITQTSEDGKGNSCSNFEASDPNEMLQKSCSSVILLPSPPSKTGSNKVAPVNAQAGARGRAVDLWKTIGISLPNLHMNNGVFTGMATNGREISILAFEVANTISKVANLSQSLSEGNIQLLKKELLQSEGMKQLISTSLEELLSIAAADKRQELDVVSREVIRFGNACKDSKWHNLDQYFSRLDLNDLSQKQAREARAALEELTVLSQNTSELYHELQALERFEQDYRRKVDEVEFLNQAGIGESLSIFQGELNVQRKLVRSFQSKCLWSRNLDEIVEKLVIVVTWINQTIAKAFGEDNTDKTLLTEDRSNGQKLGAVGLALHYANIISQINLIACRPTSIPSNMRDALYRALPTSVKIALRSRLRPVNASEELTYFDVKAEVDKILEWLAPIAANTTKAHQSCGRIGEWATQRNTAKVELNKPTIQSAFKRCTMQTK
ncbi:protein PSK SIMULATOR 2-like isoform X2 [Benincasa hispida]|uniref:protein PSK SIMULATOR 2-like isoform X2 n=1 Tax=Benincasa hispida TaxID=102211 RepID=UPI001901EDB3|nr:protein PSK SIMULATOR 2-like isoform X2 [Benincasa hispida]